MYIGVVAEIKIKSNCNDDRNYHFLIRCFFIMEVWKDIKGYEGLYQVNNLGNIKSFYLGKEKLLKLYLDKRGYYRINLWKNTKKITYDVHQLVAMAFLNHTPCGYKLVINHKDFNRLNNQVDNLEIVTQRTNTNKKHLKSTSKFTGVHWNKNNNKWVASIMLNGKAKRLGYFDNEIEASQYYENALINYELGLPIEVKKPNFSSKYKGVCFRKNNNKWQARIMINGKQKNLGYFNTELEAHLAYETESFSNGTIEI